MSWSKLVRFRLKNYTQFVDTTIDFEQDNGVYVFKGLNGNGKSNVLTGLNELFSYINSKNDKNNIQYGKAESLLQATFSDGVMIEKRKKRTGKTAYTIFKDGEVVFTTVVQGEWTPVNVMPEAIERYLGLPRSEKVNLLHRVQRDKLLLLDTTGGENYEFLSSSLNNKELHLSLQLINKDRVALRKTVEQLQTEYLAYLKVIKGQRELSRGLVDGLKELDKEIDRVNERFAELDAIAAYVDDLNELSERGLSVELPMVEQEQQLTALNSILKGVDELKGLQGVNTLELPKIVSSERLEVLNSILRVTAQLTELAKDQQQGLSALVEFRDSLGLDREVAKIKTLELMVGKHEECLGLAQEMQALDIKLSGWQAFLTKAYSVLEQNGYKLHTCKHCGVVSLEPCGHTES